MIGTKKIIQKNTVGQAYKNLVMNALYKSILFSVKKTIINETVVLVQKDITKAKINNLYFFILKS